MPDPRKDPRDPANRAPSPSTPGGPTSPHPADEPTQVNFPRAEPVWPNPLAGPSLGGTHAIGADEADDLPSWSADVSHHSSWAPQDALLEPPSSDLEAVPPTDRDEESSETAPDVPDVDGTDFAAVSALEAVHGLTPGSTPSGSRSVPTDGFDPEELSPARLVEGAILLKKYVLQKKIGSGGMGEVWKVHHIELDCTRALKFIRTGLAPSRELRERFRREARVMAKVTHDNAVAIHDAFTAGGMAFIEMAFVPGQTLLELLNLRPGRPMPLDWTTRILQQLCEVLAQAHEAGIVHRDLKPANLMLLKGRAPGREFLKVLDFGIAKLLAVEDSPEGISITNNGPIGTYAYMSPEQFGTAPVDTRSDIYTVGVILFELLTGYRPYSAKNQLYQWLQKHVNDPIPGFRDRNPDADVPPEIEAVVRRCLAKSPDDRPQSAQALFEEFEAASGTLLPPPGRTASSSLLTPVAPTSSETPARPSTRPEVTVRQDSPALESEQGWSDPTTLPGSGPGDWERGAAMTAPDSSPAHPAELARKPDPAAPGKGRRPGRRTILAASAILAVLASIAALAPSLLKPSGTKPKPPETRSVVPAFGLVSSGLEWNGIKFDKYEHNVDHLAVYLPEGYRPVGAARAEDDWPKVVARPEGPEFVRIAGTDAYKARKPVWTKDDPEAGRWHRDYDPQEDREHIVAIPGFYIQRLEVTNREVERFRDSKKDDPGAVSLLESWFTIYAAKCKNKNAKGECEYADFPAVSLTRDAARAVASRSGGVLPGRDQWEFAASSRGLRTKFVWGEAPSEGTVSIATGTIRRAEAALSPADITEQQVANMGGNAREWTVDDVQGMAVVCGGCFDDPDPADVDACGVKATHLNNPKLPDFTVGIRVVLNCPTKADMPGP